jgi:hypothetical protein
MLPDGGLGRNAAAEINREGGKGPGADGRYFRIPDGNGRAAGGGGLTIRELARLRPGVALVVGDGRVVVGVAVGRCQVIGSDDQNENIVDRGRDASDDPGRTGDFVVGPCPDKLIAPRAPRVRGQKRTRPELRREAFSFFYEPK